MTEARDEESLLREAIDRSRGNISAAAKMLGISRPTLYAKMKNTDSNCRSIRSYCSLSPSRPSWR